MPDSKITALASIGTGTDPANDPLVIVDVSDTTMAATGTTKKVSLNNLLACSPTATLASATITGALTVNGLSTMSGAFGGNYGLTLTNTTNNAAGFLRIGGTGTGGGGEIDFYNGSTPWGGIKCVASSQLDFLSSSFSTLMTLNSTGLGVGGSPADGRLLTIGSLSSVSATASAINVYSSKATLNITADGATNAAGTTISYSWANGGQGPLTFRNASIANVMTLDASGNVGVGVTPSAWASAWKANEIQRAGNALVSNAVNSMGLTSNAYLDSVGWKYGATGTANFLAAGNGNGSFAFYTAASGTAGNAITFTQAMTLDASGNLIVGNTAASNVGATGGVVHVPNSGNTYTLIGHTNGSASGSQYLYFFYNSSPIGSITQNGTTGVLYNINSDYRLKESVAPLSGGLARVNALKPSIYKWKSDGSAGEGFLAHELAEVVPFAVTGEKDDVNEDGSIKSQGIDMSRIVPILVAAIKELSAEVNALKNA